MICCLGWNIALFDSLDQQEEQIGRLWERIHADNRKEPRPGLEQGFKQDLRAVVRQKRLLFPWLHSAIKSAYLVRVDQHDVLQVTANNSDHEFKVVTHPDPMGLPKIIEQLRLMQENTQKQVGLARRLRSVPEALGDIAITQMITAYCVQRADLLGYHRLLSLWRETQPGPSVKRVIAHWLGVIAEIDKTSEAVIQTLAGDPDYAS